MFMKGKPMKFFTAVLAALAGAVLFLAGCGGEKKADELVMVTKANFPPYEFRSGGQIVGFDVDIVSAAAEKLGRKLVVREARFDELLDLVASGKAHVAAAGLTVTEDRKQKVLFTIPYDRAAQMILVPAGSKITGKEDLKKGARIGCQGGTTAFDYLRQNIITDKDSPLLRTFDSTALAVEAMNAGELDAVVCDAELASGFVVRDQQRLRLLDVFLTQEEYAIALNKKDTELCRVFDEVIGELKASGRIRKLKTQNQYLAENYGDSGSVPDSAAVAGHEESGGWLSDAWDSLKDSFHTNFVADNRWEYLAGGFVKTIEISFFAVLLGILLGFTVAVIRSTHDRIGKLPVLNFLCKIYLTVIRGTPTVVQLLIIYFVILKSCDNKVLVAIIAFGVNSGAYVAEIIRGGIMSIDKGQFEAGHSLGLSYLQVMVRIILPQVFKNVLPALGNEFIVLIKETSISGYIALQDLTNGGDIIRSQTYDAFMPLMAVAGIYLACVMLLTWLLGILERKLKKNE